MNYKRKTMSKRAKKLLKHINFGYSKLLHWYEGYEFCEFVVYEAGDTVTFRVYDDGSVYVR